MNSILHVALLAGAFGPVPLSHEQQESPAAGSRATEDERPTSAGPDVVTQLVAAHRLALESGNALELASALARMTGFDNPEFRDAALVALAYKPTRADREASQREAAELGLTNRKELDRILEQRVARVQAAAAWVLAAQRGDEKIGATLARTLRAKDFLDTRPEAAAAIIEALGKLGDRRPEREFRKELERFGDPRIQRACIRYFGWIETRDRGIVRFLCEQLDAPEPASVDSATNPPASYWEERWKAWNHWRRDLTWALRRITGETFQPAEGGQPSDRKKALAWLEAHGPGRGIR